MLAVFSFVTRFLVFLFVTILLVFVFVTRFRSSLGCFSEQILCLVQPGMRAWRREAQGHPQGVDQQVARYSGEAFVRRVRSIAIRPPVLTLGYIFCWRTSKGSSIRVRANRGGGIAHP